MSWTADEALLKVDELLDEIQTVRDLARGSDSQDVYTKLNTVEIGLRLLREYLIEADGS